jgi:hypothetical protein
MKLKKWLLVVFALGALAAQADWVYDLADVSIPDGDSLGIQRTIDLSFNGYLESLESVEVQLNISGDSSYAFGGDLYVALLCETGGRAVLLNRVGKTVLNPFGSDVNGFAIVFSLPGADIHILDDVDSALDGEGRLTGTWDADGRDIDPDLVVDTTPRTAGLDQFAGINPNGKWTLFVADVSSGGLAKLDSWGVNITAIPEPTVISLISFMGLGTLFFRRVFQKS